MHFYSLPLPTLAITGNEAGFLQVSWSPCLRVANPTSCILTVTYIYPLFTLISWHEMSKSDYRQLIQTTTKVAILSSEHLML